MSDYEYFEMIKFLSCAPNEEGSIASKAIYILSDMAMCEGDTSRSQQEWALEYYRLNKAIDAKAWRDSCNQN